MLDATHAPVAGEDYAWAHAAISVNYGIPPEKLTDKIELLKQTVEEEGWSGVRFRSVIKYLLKTQKFAAWTVADILSPTSNVKLKPFHNGNLPKGQSDIYKIDGRYFWKEADGVSLPFERVTIAKPEPKSQEAPPEKCDPDRVRAILESSGIGKIPPPEKPKRPNVAEQKPNGTLTPEEIEYLSRVQREARQRINQ